MNEEAVLHILFVCTGNICRSPLAERLAVEYSTRLGISGLKASSAGTRAVIAHPIHDEAALVLERMGGSAANFAARQLTARIASDADLVLTMTKVHRDKVLELAPHKLSKTFALSEASILASTDRAESLQDLAIFRPRLAGTDWFDVPDPIGQTPGVFASVGSQIADLLQPILELCRRASTLKSD